MRHNSPAERLARSRLMLAHSWPQRLEELSTIVNNATGCDGEAAAAEDRQAPASRTVRPAVMAVPAGASC